MQILGLVNPCHLLEIALLAEAAFKHYVWTTNNDFKAEKLDLSNMFSEEFKHPFVNRLKQPLGIPREWDELIAIRITGGHLAVGPLTTVDREK